MNALTAAELKRRGMAAIEEGLRRGPVHLVKRNKATAVVVSAKEYARLSKADSAKPQGMTAVDWLLSQPSKGTRSKKDMDDALNTERDSWS